MVQRFPFGDAVLEDLAILDISHNYVTLPKFEQPSLFVVVLRLATKFCPHVDREMVKDEFEDLQLMEDDAVVTRVDGHQRQLDHIWGDVMDMKTAMGVMRFPSISTLFTATLTRSGLSPC